MYLLYNCWAVVTASIAALLHPDREHFHCPEKFFHDSVTHPKRNVKNNFFFLFSSIDLPQHTCVSFSFLSIIATLAVCQFVGFKQGGAYWLYWLGRGEYALLFFYFVLSELSHTLWNPHACIHSSISPPPPTFHWSLPHTPSYPSIQLFVECLPWVMGHQESHPHLIYVLLGKPDSLPTTLRRSYISDGEV